MRIARVHTHTFRKQLRDHLDRVAKATEGLVITRAGEDVAVVLPLKCLEALGPEFREAFRSAGEPS